MGLTLTDLTEEQRKELELKNGVLVEDIAPGVRGNVQPGDVILAIISRGTTTEAKSAEQVNALFGKLDKGASVALKLRRGEQQLVASIRLNNVE
jgi:serine protease Do